MMLLCCLAMVGAFFLVSGETGGSGTFSLLLPLAACLGVHFLMHKMTGKSCHDSKKSEENRAEETTSTPVQSKILPRTTD
jgi:hypothetical protein